LIHYGDVPGRGRLDGVRSEERIVRNSQRWSQEKDSPLSILIFMHLRYNAATAQDRLPGSRVCEGHIFERSNAPDPVLSRQYGEDQRIHLMWSGRVSGTGRQATPEMYDHHAVSNVSDINQLIFERRVAIDCFVNGNMERHDLIDALDIVPEAIYERRVFIEQGAESSHVVSVPSDLECIGRIFWFFHFKYGRAAKHCEKEKSKEDAAPIWGVAWSMSSSLRPVQALKSLVRQGFVGPQIRRLGRRRMSCTVEIGV
jgi:hypothetical protein